MATTPLLSIGMIFKNEERCLERCLKSLQPLRKAVPCELVMADTGAADGSRAIAERYADTVFDFEWIDDFAAARNAVMDRCSGKWHMSIDCDEWLDADISELVAFLRGEKKVNHGFVVVRNYFSAELEKGENYSDFHAMRLLRMSTGQRYVGAIHECCPYANPVARLTRTILHHDGYYFADPKTAAKKRQRNLKLLRQKLQQEPENLLVLNQCIESSNGSPDQIQYIRSGVDLVQKKAPQWQAYGGIVLAHAVEAARLLQLPELKEWTGLAEAQLPDSIFVRVDVNHSAFQAAHDAGEWEDAIRYGEAYREGLRALRAEELSENVKVDLGAGSLIFGNQSSERTLLIGLANACRQAGQEERALELLAGLDGGKLYPVQVRNVVIALSQLHAETPLDAAPAMTAFYEQISKAEPDGQKRKARLAAFDSIAAAAFSEGYRRTEQQHMGYRRPAYTAFRCLSGECEAGRAAGLMMAIEPEEIRAWLLQVEDWQALPIEALQYALREGVAFPLPEKPLSSEVMSGLAARLTRGENMARELALAPAENREHSGLQSLFWAQSLVLAALQRFDWTLGKNDAPVSEFACPEKKKDETGDPSLKDTPETGLALIRRFARVETALLPILYTPQMLTEENAALLPPKHRWGVYCTRALEALDAGKPQEYLAVLRRGLKACPGEKNMVQFLLDRFQEDIRPKASPELLALAEKVRTILAAYGPADPAVAALKASPAYRQVAWIIEEPTAGGLPS